VNRQNTKCIEKTAILSAKRYVVVLQDKLEFMHKLINSGKSSNIEFAKRIAREDFVNRKNTIHFKLLDCIKKFSNLSDASNVDMWSSAIDGVSKQIITQESYDARSLRNFCGIIEDALLLAKKDVLKISSLIDKKKENE
jgi:hypothetical protein